MRLPGGRRTRFTRRRALGWCGVTATLGVLAACGTPAPLTRPTLPTAAAATDAPSPGSAGAAEPATLAPAQPSPVANTQPRPTDPASPTVQARPASTATALSGTGRSTDGLNYLHTVGARIVDAAGQPVTLTGLNWFGMETGTLAPHGLWARPLGDMLDQIVQAGFNCLRLPYSNALFDPKRQPNGIDFNQNPGLEGLGGLQIMDAVVVAAGRHGLKVFLDQHRPNADQQSPLWYTDHLSAETWIAQWRALAARYRGNDAVIGADLHNEPAGAATWGSGDPKTDWAIAAETCANEILGANPDWLILVEGVEKIVDASGNPIDWTWQGGNLMNVAARPIRSSVPNRVVYSPHDYGPGVYNQKWFSDPAFPDNLPPFWDKHWGYLQKNGVAPILVGEFGGRSVGRDTEGTWQRALVAYLKANQMHYTYWCLNPNSGDTGGLLGDDWKTINPDKAALLKTYQGKPLPNRAPTVVNEDAVPPAVATG